MACKDHTNTHTSHQHACGCSTPTTGNTHCIRPAPSPDILALEGVQRRGKYYNKTQATVVCTTSQVHLVSYVHVTPPHGKENGHSGGRHRENCDSSAANSHQTGLSAEIHKFAVVFNGFLTVYEPPLSRSFLEQTNKTSGHDQLLLYLGKLATPIQLLHSHISELCK